MTLIHRASGAAEYRGLRAELVVTIRENDPGLVFSEATYTVALQTQPTADVTVTVSGVSGDLSLDQTELVFTPGNWGDEQTVTVMAADDTATDPAVSLTHRAAGGGYDDVVGTVRVTIRDVPPPPPPRPGPGGGGGGAPACTQDDVHGNSVTQATDIVLGTEPAGAICPAADVDYFTVTAPGRGLVFIDTTGSLNLRGMLWQDGVVLASGPTGRRPGTRLGTRVQPGSVTVALQGQGGATGAYEAIVTFVPGYLENPGPDSFQSGVGVLSGWVCDAEDIEITLGALAPQIAAYGTERTDTLAVCGDSDNGFGLLFNWNLLGDGEHEVVTRVEGVELGRAMVTVTTFGEEFLRGVEGECLVEDFPYAGERMRVVWQQNQQNFVVAEGPQLVGIPSVPAASLTGFLENPAPYSFQSGIGVISGWVCEAEEVEITLGALPPQIAAYGTERVDTARDCGDTDNGFGLLFNWNLLGAGEHVVVARVDGEELGRATVRATTLGAEFLRGVAGECVVEDFPTLGETVTLEWRQGQQNFVITGAE